MPDLCGRWGRTAVPDGGTGIRSVIRFLGLAVVVAGLSAAALVQGPAGAQPPGNHRSFLAGLSRSEEPPPTPISEPPIYGGPVVSLYLESAHLYGNDPVEQRVATSERGREVLQDPSGPTTIAWYPAFGHPGFRATNSLFAAHVDYVNYGRAPFWYLTNAVIGDHLIVTMDNGLAYIYSVQSVDVISLSSLDMQAIVFPALEVYRERITLISCGGTFVPYPGGGGEYQSRVVLVAERIIS